MGLNDLQRPETYVWAPAPGTKRARSTALAEHWDAWGYSYANTDSVECLNGEAGERGAYSFDEIDTDWYQNAEIRHYLFGGNAGSGALNGDLRTDHRALRDHQRSDQDSNRRAPP